jgi:hypothetical protein
MSRLTGNDAKSLMEAYSAVYAPQEEVELTEEQVWEEVENWVNSLLEEGYDLSEYTWEEMYESYIEEQGTRGRGTGGGAEATAREVGAVNKALSGAASAVGQSLQRANTVPTARPAGARQNLRGGGSRPVTASAKPAAAAPPTAPAAAASAARPAAAASAARPAAAASAAAPAAAAPATRPAAAASASRPSTPAARPAAAKVAPTKPAAAQTGDKAKDTATWAKANPTLASKVTPSGTQAGTGQSQMSKQAAELRAMRQRSQERQGVKTEEYDAYDLVLEYLLSEGHADTVEEAHYVMMEMDAEMIGTIVEAAADQSDKQIDKGVKTTYKAQNVLDNQHQGRSKGLNKLPAGERASKTKRMQGRLKARRDDLFGERNKREDSRRDELKKMLGL